MERKGYGYLHEMLIGLIILFIVISFYMGSMAPLIPIFVLVLGSTLILLGLGMKNAILITAGIMLLAFSIIYVRL